MNRLLQTRLSRDSLRTWILNLPIFGLLLIGCGCSLTTPANPDGHDTSTSEIAEHPPAADVFMSLAYAVDAGSITNSNQLAQTVLVLANNGDLSLVDVKKFDVAFPDATTSDRSLTQVDANLLRGIK